MRISSAEPENFRRKGFVLLRAVFSTEWIEDLLGGFRQNLESPWPMSRIFADEGDGESFFRNAIIRPRIEEFSRFARRPPAVRQALREVLGHSSSLVCSPGFPTRNRPARGRCDSGSEHALLWPARRA